MYKGGFVDTDIFKPLERPAWYLIEGQLIHCTSSEIPMIKRILAETRGDG